MYRLLEQSGIINNYFGSMASLRGLIMNTYLILIYGIETRFTWHTQYQNIWNVYFVLILIFGIQFWLMK